MVRVTSAVRTVADCFKFRNKIGLDVALEALREAWAARRVTMDELDLIKVSAVLTAPVGLRTATPNVAEGLPALLAIEWA